MVRPNLCVSRGSWSCVPISRLPHRAIPFLDTELMRWSRGSVQAGFWRRCTRRGAGACDVCWGVGWGLMGVWVTWVGGHMWGRGSSSEELKRVGGFCVARAPSLGRIGAGLAAWGWKGKK